MAPPAAPAGPYAALLRRRLTRRHSRLLVTGMRGSGATAVASLLQQIGFFLGPAPAPRTLEDPGLQRLLAAGDCAAAQAMLEAWSAEHPRVACKSAELFLPACLPLLQALPTDWLVLAVCRDPAALAQRSALSAGVDLAQALIDFAQQQDQLVRFAKSIDKSVLFVSYERLMLTPEVALAEILAHVDPGSVPLPAFDAIWDTLLRQRKQYRQQPRPTPAISGEPLP